MIAILLMFFCDSKNKLVDMNITVKYAYNIRTCSSDRSERGFTNIPRLSQFTDSRIHLGADHKEKPY